LYLDKTQKSYEHSIIVQPNFGSVDIQRVDLIESKNKIKDTVFLKTCSWNSSSKRLSKVKLNPLQMCTICLKNTPENF
jgi:hypothetical protein